MIEKKAYELEHRPVQKKVLLLVKICSHRLTITRATLVSRIGSLTIQVAMTNDMSQNESESSNTNAKLNNKNVRVTWCTEQNVAGCAVRGGDQV